jgi:hypothetical protein
MPWEALAAVAYGTMLVVLGRRHLREPRRRRPAAAAVVLGCLAALGGVLLLLGLASGRGIALLPAVIVFLVVGWWIAQGLLQEEPAGLARPVLLLAASGVVAALLVTGGCAPGPPAGAPAVDSGIRGIEEPSGVARMGDRLLIVGDGEAGTYYSLAVPGTPGATVPLAPPALSRHRLPGNPHATDLEAIGVLADGRIVVLSEDLPGLLDDEGVVATYADLREAGGRGCEGLAIRDLGGGASRVAVLWEGGYAEGAAEAWMPRILVHDVPPGASGRTVGPSSAAADIRLRVPHPAGVEPQAQRFRCPALVWHRLRQDDPDSWGFIALLSSGWAAKPMAGSEEECPKRPDGTPLRWCYKWIQRFDAAGDPVGEPLDLDPFFPAAIRHSNWEGMGWFEPGRSLVLVYDERVDFRVLDPQVAVIVPLPEGW